MFRKRDGSLVGSQFLYRELLVSCFFVGSLCDVTSFSLIPGSQTLSGASVHLICTLDRYTGEVSIIKSADTTSVGIALTKCNEEACRNSNPDYHFTITGNSVLITIKSLQRNKDQAWWTCRTTRTNSQLSERQFYLTVYTVPSSITLVGPTKACDLGLSRCEYTCKTDQCTYPSPSFTWLYVFDDDTTADISHTSSITGKYNGCTDSTKIYEDKLTFQRYELYTGNTQKTVRLRCYITFTSFSSERLISGVSQDLIFAVQVSAVQIFDGTTELTGNTFTVNDKEEKVLKCIPGSGNPTPTVQWFIGNNPVSTTSEFIFITDNSHHGQQIYCVADNIPNNGDDAVSNKPILFVNVKIQFVYIEPAPDTFISVIEDTPEPVVCTTSAGRPRSTIKWYKNNVELGVGNITHFEMTDKILEVTKSTRYVEVSRSDSSWALSCSASNFEGSTPLWANNSKRFIVLYPPEQMTLLFDEKPVVGPLIDVIKGTPGILRCEASSNPLASFFSWNNKQIVGNTWTISDSIQNGLIVNCTAGNVMETSSGTTVTRYNSISKTINLQYGAFIERIEVNGNEGPTWVIKETDPLLIACYVDSNPDSTISLFQGANPVRKQEQSTVLIYNISSAQCSHTSLYTCRADNGITNIEQPAVKTVQINVACSPRLAFETDLSVFAKENATAVLSATVLAYPVSTQYRWYRNISNRWEELTNTQAILISRVSLQFRLIIIHVTPGDYGEYKLTVDNTVGDPFNITFVLQTDDSLPSHHLPVNEADDDKVDASKLSAVEGAMGTVRVLLVGTVIILALIIWRNHNGVICKKKDNLTYEMPNRATRGSEDRTYDIVNQSISEYENAAP